MSLHFLIDGYNVIKKYDYLWKKTTLNQARISLLRSINSMKIAKNKNNQITVIFDGKEKIIFPRQQSHGLINIVFTKGDSADEEIKRLIQDSPRPKQIVVVSDDKSLIFFTRSLGTKAMSVTDFLSKEKKSLCAKGRKSSPKLAKIELTLQQQSAINQELRAIWGA